MSADHVHDVGSYRCPWQLRNSVLETTHTHSPTESTAFVEYIHDCSPFHSVAALHD